jgi:hypothetical protein
MPPIVINPLTLDGRLVAVEASPSGVVIATYQPVG